MILPNDSDECRLDPPESGVTVRMYNPGFGDCLLLAFRAEDGQARYMLIDCGVHHQYAGGKEKMQLVVEDIARATAGRLHVVAITHEHTDHLTGFKYAKDTFDNIQIDDLWLAWTENPDDQDAGKLKQLYGLRMQALTQAIEQINLTNEPLAGALRSVLDFEMPIAAAGKVTELEYLRAKSKKKLLSPEDYRHPGEPPLTLPGVKGVKIYVLAPPRAPAWIKELGNEGVLYPELVAAEAGATVDEGLSYLKSRSPFHESFRIMRDDASTHPDYGGFFRETYGFTDQEKQGPTWRRIDTDWLAAAEQLALKINSYTNNTSLVLAIELTATTPHKVLLFAADAQVGNWLSWWGKDVSWPGEGEGSAKVNADYLLARTVLYKVGHHGSRNATLSEKGLEKMNHADLVVMIPVDEKWAREEKGWEHPAEKLLERLIEKSKGRVIRSDVIPIGDESPSQPNQATESAWQAFIAQLEWDRPNKLWIQYTVPG